MCTYMLCIWWVCICGSNVSGGEHVGLNTKADFACGSSPLPVLLACLVLSLLAPACLSVLTPTNCADKTNSSATKESRPQAASSFTVASRHKVDLEKMTLNVQRRANLQGSPNKHSTWHLRHQDNRDPVVVSLCTCHSEQISPGTHPPPHLQTSQEKDSVPLSALLLTTSALYVCQVCGTMVSFSFALICQGQD